MYKISDFKKGQTAYLELTGNARRRKSGEELIRECQIEAVGRKYVTADRTRFEEHDCNYGGLIEHTDYSVNFVLYPTKQAIYDKFEKEELISTISSIFGGYSSRGKENLSLEQLRRIKQILEEVN